MALGFSQSPKNRFRRAVDVNPPVTVRNRAAIVAAGTHADGICRQGWQ
jgi:hypothetical protein